MQMKSPNSPSRLKQKENADRYEYQKIYYFDYNATHPPFAEILRKNLDFYINNFYNPSGASRFSLAVQNEIEKSRTIMAELTGKRKNDFTFVSTGTEANYLLLNSISKNNSLPNKVIISPYEHPSVSSGAKSLGLETIILSGNKSGAIDLSELANEVKRNQAAVMITGAANETGVIQPLAKIQEITREANVPLYSDLMQAFGKIEAPFFSLDGFSAASHKIGGGPGSALAYISPAYMLSDLAIFTGGNQENSRRAGTENVPAILSFADAAQKKIKLIATTEKKLFSFQQRIETALKIAGAEIIAENSQRLANTTYAILPIDDIDFFLIALEEKGIIVSTGSSCKSRVREPSASLLNMGYSKEEAMRAIRISTGFFTNEEDVNYLIENLTSVIHKFKA